MSAVRLTVKICGVTRPADALDAAAAGADFVGLIRAPGPRAAADDSVAEIVATLPPATRPVLLLVDAPVAQIVAEARRFGVAHVQLHGRETAEAVAALQSAAPELQIIRAWPVKEMRDAEALDAYLDRLRQLGVRLAAVVVDSPKGAAAAPADECFVAAATVCRAQGVPAWRAGGLTPGSVAQVLREAPAGYFAGVDVARGVETSPGIKDRGRIRAFVRAARVVHAG